VASCNLRRLSGLGPGASSSGGQATKSIEMEEVLVACAKDDVAVEINANPCGSTWIGDGTRRLSRSAA